MKRIFLGIPLDPGSQRRINQLLTPFKGPQRGIRWVPENNRHLTLAFLGNQPGSIIDQLIASFDSCFGHVNSFNYEFSRLSRFPGSKGRIIALVGQPAEPLTGLSLLTKNMLQSHGLKTDTRAFRPHLTLARLGRTAPAHTVIKQDTDICLKIDRVRLYQSTLFESGAVYQSLKQTRLKSP